MRTTRIIRRTLRLIVVIATACTLTGCGGTDREGGGTAGRGGREPAALRVGTDATYPPFETVDTQTGEVSGFDIDLMREIAREMDVSVEFIVTPFDGIVAGLRNDKYDAIISAFTITPERAEQALFSDPYYDAGQTIAVRAADDRIAGESDLTGLSLGVQLGTTGERRAKQVDGAEVFSYENIGAAFIDLENERIDAVINDKPTTEMFIKQRGTAKIVGPVLTAEHYGIAVRPDDTLRIQQINAALQEIKTDGRIDSLKAKWF